ncbi:LacI family transcriptional regulator [Sphingomonas naasensis]|uniref:LacI family transcriptional regulator n=1 Tax=Sphingomonas naasensis TaxID=1344951 RepID=A0A4S1WJB0_9SPHN|nr:LacI family DNA-binding transcriptional regulator [Sphingomonas naasensis]NIJ20893.1 LacI family transcriptional regulator [Sphingomonas naasensis]TGX43284.1 LacI family transcriptional regulator [Sphingomonas naasensis]
MGEATIRDVARRAEVSVASVSRALNGLNNVRGETRERIVAAAKELGYVPHAGARSLSLARAHAIGVVLPDLHGEFFSECVRGMDREASRRGYVLLLSNMHDDSEQSAAALRTMRGRVDGLLVMAPHITPESLERALPAALPAVLINAPGEVAARPALRLDNHAGAHAMVEHLLAGGYRHIVHIAGPESNVDAQERLQGYRDALAALAPDMPVRVIAGDFNEEAGEAAARQILASHEPCDAVFAANDMMAIGCLHTLRQAGKRVPEDIAVAGFDDVPLARYLALTTIEVRIAEIGARAVSRLVDMLEGKGPGGGVELYAPELIARATTAARTGATAHG